MMHTLHLLSGIVYYAPFCSASQSIGCRLGGGAKRRNTWTSHPLAIPVVPIPPLALPWLSLFTLPYINPILIHAQGPGMTVPPTTHYLAYTIGPTDAL